MSSSTGTSPQRRKRAAPEPASSPMDPSLSPAAKRAHTTTPPTATSPNRTPTNKRPGSAPNDEDASAVSSPTPRRPSAPPPTVGAVAPAPTPPSPTAHAHRDRPAAAAGTDSSSPHHPLPPALSPHRPLRAGGALSLGGSDDEDAANADRRRSHRASLDQQKHGERSRSRSRSPVPRDGPGAVVPPSLPAFGSAAASAGKPLTGFGALAAAGAGKSTSAFASTASTGGGGGLSGFAAFAAPGSSTRLKGFGSFAAAAAAAGSPTTGGLKGFGTSVTAKPLATDGDASAALGGFGAAAKEDDEDADENDDHDDAPAAPSAFAPQVTLVSPVAVTTGEEDEVSVHTVRARAFVRDAATGNPIDRGIGTLRVNVRQRSDGSLESARIVMRAEGVLNVIVNARILKGMQARATDTDPRFVQFATAHDGKLVTYLFKVNPALRQDLMDAINDQADQL